MAVKRLAQEAGPGTAAGLTSAEQFEAEVKPIHFIRPTLCGASPWMKMSSRPQNDFAARAKVRVIASCSHPHLLPVIGYCDEGGAEEGNLTGMAQTLGQL